MADQVDVRDMSVSIAQSAESAVASTPASSSSDYIPAVGDVVEFEYEGVTCRGVHGPIDLIAAHYGENGKYGRGGFTYSMAGEMRYTGRTIEGITTWRAAEQAGDAIAKAYFFALEPVK